MKNKKENLIFFDTETTGIEEEDRICQVALKESIDGRENVQYFKPPVPISIDAMSITHITNEMVKNKRAFNKKESSMYRYFKGREDKDIFVAHNADFDLKMLAREKIIPKRHICTMKLAYHLDKKAEFGKYNLQYLRYMFNLKIDREINPHDAMSDVIVLEALFNQVFLKKYTVEEMVKISSEPILFRKWMFGKHKGETFQHVAQVDFDYLLWFRRQADIDENMRHTLNYWINKRN